MDQQTWRSMGLILTVAVLLALAAGCGSAAPEPTAGPAKAEATVETAGEESAAAYPLAATAWDLESFGPPEQSTPVLPNTHVTLVYFWDRYAGFDGCNFLLGSYTTTPKGELIMNAPSRTLYANLCEPAEVYEQAARYATSLLSVIEYQREGEQLIANAAMDQRLLTYNPAKVVPMLGTEWRLAFWWYAALQQFNPAVPASMTTITFGEGAEASGSGGCNNYTASYEGDLKVEKMMEATDTYADLPTLTFGPVAAQLATCTEPEGIMDQEQAYFTTLGSVAYYFKLGGMLMMLDAEGVPLLMFSGGN